MLDVRADGWLCYVRADARLFCRISGPITLPCAKPFEGQMHEAGHSVKRPIELCFDEIEIQDLGLNWSQIESLNLYLCLARSLTVYY